MLRTTANGNVLAQQRIDLTHRNWEEILYTTTHDVIM